VTSKQIALSTPFATCTNNAIGGGFLLSLTSRAGQKQPSVCTYATGAR
jgi:hypothetical protein